MNRKGLFYGSSTGNTQSAAQVIAKSLGIGAADIFDIARATPESMQDYDVLVLGSSTSGVGDLQEDWESFISQFEKLNLSGKKVAVFGMGDSFSHPDTFCDAVGIIAGTAEKAGATLVGKGTDTSGYTFDSSRTVRDGAFCGLPLDDDNESDKTNERISRWVEQLKTEI